MNQIMVVYWSQTGNTEAMANAVAEGVKEAGMECTVAEVSSVSADVLKDAPVFALGCPAMGAEVLEEDEMEPFMEAVEAFAGGRSVCLALMDGETASGCVTGRSAFRMPGLFW